MILRRHFPGPTVGRFVEFLWYYQDWAGSHPREHVLPDGAFELVINLREEPRKLFDRADSARYSSFRGGWLSGTHAQYIVIDALPGASMIGAHFKPGGAAPFLAPSAAEFQNQVVDMEAVWGTRVHPLRERLLAAPDPAAKFRHLEQFLASLLSVKRLDEKREAGMSWAIGQLSRQSGVQGIGGVAQRMNLSHKHFIAQFRDRVGLNPKLFCRIRRFQQVLAQINAQRAVNWAEVAYGCGYYDQSHLVNDFQAFAGLNPTAYRSLGSDHASFVPIAEGR